jgi:hypothetical protein
MIFYFKILVQNMKKKLGESFRKKMSINLSKSCTLEQVILIIIRLYEREKENEL